MLEIEPSDFRKIKILEGQPVESPFPINLFLIKKTFIILEGLITSS